MRRQTRPTASEALPPLPPEEEPTTVTADHSAPNTAGPTSAETSAAEVTPAADPAGEHQAEGEEPAAAASAAEADQAEAEAAPEGESQGSETAAEQETEPETGTEVADEPAEAEARNSEPGDVLPLSEYVRDVYGDEVGDTEEATPNAGADRERWFEVLYDTVGSGPSFHKGEHVAESDLEFLGIERLLEIGAIREL